MELACSRFLAPPPQPPLLSSPRPQPPRVRRKERTRATDQTGEDALAPPLVLPALISRQDAPDHLLEAKSGL